MIKVITQTTAERQKETENLFNLIKPLLDEGYSYTSALKKIGKLKEKNRVYQQAWFRDLKEHGKKMGYPYEKYRGQGFKK